MGRLADIDVALERVGSKSVTYAFVFSRDAETLARATMTTVCCREGDNGGLEPIKTLAAIQAKLAAS
jgi:acyl-CoA thioesterase FadM